MLPAPTIHPDRVRASESARPTDFLLLAALAETGRNVAPNLAHHTGKSPENVDARLPVLADDGLVDTVCPVERSGRYELTALGEAALTHRELYGEVDDAEALFENTEADDALGRYLDTDGDVRDDRLPEWSEFQELAADYGVSLPP